MRYENVLLIGGPRDGEWTLVIQGIPYIRASPRTKAVAFSKENAIRSVDDTFQVFEYHRGKIRGADGQEHIVYVPSGVDAIEMLVKGYRKP